MPDYRCYFLDAKDHIIATLPPAPISAEDDMGGDQASA
jgi:hypothetical protein